MQTLSLFIDMLLGFVPFVGLAFLITASLWAATKLFPAFGAGMDAMFDGLFGVDADYDEKHDTGYTSTSNRW